MKLNTLEKVYLALRDLEPRLEMPAPTSARRRGSRSTGCSP
jgi:hypothetical protein